MAEGVALSLPVRFGRPYRGLAYFYSLLIYRAGENHSRSFLYFDRRLLKALSPSSRLRWAS